METILIKDATLVNEGDTFKGSLLIRDQKIDTIYAGEVDERQIQPTKIIDASGLILIPGVIDDQVHFRDPGLTHKGDFRSETRAALAGGVTSVMDMPNTIPQTITREALSEKFSMVSSKSLCNYSLYIGATNDNLEELAGLDPAEVCGIKVFMGSSTGNMLVDREESLNNIFRDTPCLVAVHCEDESTIRKNSGIYRERYGEDVPIKYHPIIRSEEACYVSTSLAIRLAEKYNTRLHVLHLSTARELELFESNLHHSQKKITSEVCIHHLWFDQKDYDTRGSFIKWNPAIKTSRDRLALFNGVLNGTIDIIATDHAPHTFEEKQNPYFQAPSGGPMVQHSLTVMLEFYHRYRISIEKIVEKMCHIPADIFQVKKRGYLREGYWADLCLVDLNSPWQVNKDNILYKCGWSPFEDLTFQSRVIYTFVNGHLAYDNGYLDDSRTGMRLEFDR
jgi:dihydroorotase